jgi:hypothetical protein
MDPAVNPSLFQSKFVVIIKVSTYSATTCTTLEDVLFQDVAGYDKDEIFRE